MVKTEGVASIYSGLSAALFRQASYGTARIGLFQIFCDKLKELNGGQPIPFYQKAAAGMAGGAIAVCIGALLLVVVFAAVLMLLFLFTLGSLPKQYIDVYIYICSVIGDLRGYIID